MILQIEGNGEFWYRKTKDDDYQNFCKDLLCSCLHATLTSLQTHGARERQLTDSLQKWFLIWEHTSYIPIMPIISLIKTNTLILSSLLFFLTLTTSCLVLATFCLRFIASLNKRKT